MKIKKCSTQKQIRMHKGKTNSKIVYFKTTGSVNALNVNAWNSPIKNRNRLDSKKGQNPITWLL